MNSCQKWWKNMAKKKPGYILYGVEWNNAVTIKRQWAIKIMALAGFPFVMNGDMISKPFMIGQCLTAIEMIWPLTALTTTKDIARTIVDGQPGLNKSTIDALDRLHLPTRSKMAGSFFYVQKSGFTTLKHKFSQVVCGSDPSKRHLVHNWLFATSDEKTIAHFWAKAPNLKWGQLLSWLFSPVGHWGSFPTPHSLNRAFSGPVSLRRLSGSRVSWLALPRAQLLFVDLWHWAGQICILTCLLFHFHHY